LQLTYATLSALNKYPKESLTDLEIKHATGHKNIYKKFGLEGSEKETYKKCDFNSTVCSSAYSRYSHDLPEIQIDKNFKSPQLDFIRNQSFFKTEY